MKIGTMSSGFSTGASDATEEADQAGCGGVAAVSPWSDFITDCIVERARAEVIELGKPSD
jgi:hypothetical protein